VKLFTITMLLIVGMQTNAQAACSNPINIISIPINGSTTVAVCDQSGNFLTGPYSIQFQNNGAPVNLTSSPAVSIVGGNLVFSPNVAPNGAAGGFNICFTPANKCSVIPYVVGAPVTSISFGTP
jgi:hypothetical protein